MHYFYQPIRHIRNIQGWVKAHGARFVFDVETFRATVTHNNRRITLIPRFLMKTPTGRAYSSQFGQTGAFVGWLPYELKRWPIASDKLLFKQYCEDNGLPIPEYWVTGAPTKDFIIKGRQGSFGQGIKGPYRPDQFAKISSSLAAGEYCDQFVDGDCVKIWYWNNQAIFMERLPQRYVLGDGRRSIHEIATTLRGSFDQPYELDNFSRSTLAWQGLSETDVPADGRQVILDYRYATPFDQVVTDNRDVLQLQTDAVKKELENIGDILIAAIPVEIRQHVMFTVDAVADRNNNIWLLEMNSHPMIHPLSYASILDDMLSAPLDRADNAFTLLQG